MALSKSYCCVYGCLNKSPSNPELTFFSIPTEHERRSQWLRLIGRKDLAGKVSRYQRVCEVHFNAQDVKINTNRKLIKKYSLPCFHLPSLNKEDEEIHSDLATASSSTQTEKTDLERSSISTQTEKLFRSDNITQTEPSLSAETPRKRKLKVALSQCRKRLNVQEKQETSTKSLQGKFHKLCDHFLSKDLAEIVKAQTYLKSSSRGNRYTLEYKIFCLNLYYVSPIAYRLLQDAICLPCRSTLNKLYIPITTQINDDLFAMLKMKVDNMSEREKECTMVVDAMSLKANLFYDIKNDKIIGFHEVDGVQSPLPAKHALVVLIRGIFMNWHQPIGFALLSECKSDDNISKWIDTIIL